MLLCSITPGPGLGVTIEYCSNENLPNLLQEPDTYGLLIQFFGIILIVTNYILTIRGELNYIESSRSQRIGKILLNKELILPKVKYNLDEMKSYPF